MARQYKNSYKWFSAWNYEAGIEYLNGMSEQGWQLIRGGAVSSRFKRNPDVRYRYQLDFGKVEDMGLYLETFREQGWEYVSSTFNGWRYFRKLYDPALPENAYEIFTDRASLAEMQGRWARIVTALCAPIALLFVLLTLRLLLRPDLPALAQALTLAMELAVLIRGIVIMRDPARSKNRRHDGALVAAFFAVLLLGSAASIALTELRFNTRSDMRSDYVAIEPERPLDWAGFEVKYRDSYYLDLDVEADAPLTVTLAAADGKTIYTATEASLHEKDLRLRLARGFYKLYLSDYAGGRLEAALRVD